ncbi:hypothetical protein K502DRAFT_349743 [Neoconidiobolus thromboides FSU 785]|nr:hypothetical protein K502DRAFT_349743 [Neoconidiobolus thromboides FSU 785]
MNGLKHIFLFSLAIGIFGLDNCPQQDPINTSCQTLSGRVANGDGTNTYSFSCSCISSYRNDTVQNTCGQSGPNIQFQCSGSPVISYSSTFSLEIVNCANDIVSTTFMLNDNTSRSIMSPFNCAAAGTSALQCNSTSTI